MKFVDLSSVLVNTAGGFLLIISPGEFKGETHSFREERSAHLRLELRHAELLQGQLSLEPCAATHLDPRLHHSEGSAGDGERGTSGGRTSGRGALG